MMANKKRGRSTGYRNSNADLRRQVQMPGPEIAVLEENLQQLLRPEDFLPIRQSHQIPERLRRDRLLTLPVMLAVVLGLIYRKIPGLAAASRVLWDEGLLWVAPLKVSRQALSKRLMTLPARHFAAIFEAAAALECRGSGPIASEVQRHLDSRWLNLGRTAQTAEAPSEPGYALGGPDDDGGGFVHPSPRRQLVYP
jgi:hypothetical protein